MTTTATEIFDPGVFDITNAQYHASNGISRSHLWRFNECPYKYWYEYLSGQYVKLADTEALIMGNLVHTLVLEPKLINDQYFIIQQKAIPRKDTAPYQKIIAEANGKTIITIPQLDLAKSMREAVYSNETAMDIMHDAKIEQSIYWRDAATGILCKARPDIMNGHIVADLKTTSDASFRGFQSSAYNYGYFLQAAMIYEATRSLDLPFEKFIFICVEKSAPNLVGLYVLDDQALQFGLDLFHLLLKKLAKCLEEDKWPGYEPQLLTVPNYATLGVQNNE